MGIHYPFGYTGYESAFLHTFIELLDNFCTGCHTNDDVNQNCRLCPVGQMIYASKEYLLKAYEGQDLKEEKKVIKAIKVEIKKIKPCPHFQNNWIFNEKRNKDKLLKLRELLKDLRFFEGNHLLGFIYKSKIEERIFKQVLKETKKRMENLKRKKNERRKK